MLLLLVAEVMVAIVVLPAIVMVVLAVSESVLIIVLVVKVLLPQIGVISGICTFVGFFLGIGFVGNRFSVLWFFQFFRFLCRLNRGGAKGWRIFRAWLIHHNEDIGNLATTVVERFKSSLRLRLPIHDGVRQAFDLAGKLVLNDTITNKIQHPLYKGEGSQPFKLTGEHRKCREIGVKIERGLSPR